MKSTHAAIASLLAVVLLAWMAPIRALPTKAPPAIAVDGSAVSPAEAGRWARGMILVAGTVSEKYPHPVTPPKLLGGAVRRLYAQAGVRLPDRYQDNPEAALERVQDLEIELIRARLAAGNPAAIQGELAIRAGLEGMLSVLDPHSVYLSSEELGLNFYDERLGQAGMTFEERDGRGGPLVVRSVARGSSAAAEGIQPGDEVISIGGKPTETMSASKGRSLLHGRPGATAPLAVRPFRAQLIRAVNLPILSVKEEETVFGYRRLPEEGWNCFVDGKRGVAYVRVTMIRSSDYRFSDSDVVTHEALEALMNRHYGNGLRGLVLDLRDSPSGYLPPMDKIISMFLKEGVLRYTKDRDQEMVEKRGGGGRFLDFPMIVLIGPETSGAGELIAAALRDNRRATLAGERTRGKGSIQEIIDRSNNSVPDWPFPGHGMRVTTGFSYRPNQQPIQRMADSRLSDPWGVQPDPGFEVVTSIELRRQIRRWRHQQEARAPNDDRALPLDDPANDPVLATALQHLRKQIDAKK